MPLHTTLTDPFLHEPKGIAAAAANLVYTSDGVGSGSWRRSSYVISGAFADVSTPATIYIPVTRAGLITKVVGVLSGPITVANSIVTVRNSAAASMGTINVLFTGSAAGTVFTLNPVTNNIVGADDYISLVTDGTSTTTAIMAFSIEVSAT